MEASTIKLGYTKKKKASQQTFHTVATFDI